MPSPSRDAKAKKAPASRDTGRRRRAAAAKPKVSRIEQRAARCQTSYKHSARARRELDRFVSFCAIVGLQLEPFQRLILLEVFDGRRELVVLIPRGNGKTTLFAALALWHLLTHPAPRVYLAAASKDQADLAFEAARDFARSHPSLKKRVRIKFRRIERADGAGYMRVLSSDAGRAHGLMPTLALVDELHAHKNGHLYVALKTAMGKNLEAQLVTISTAGHDEEEQLGRMRRDAFEAGAIEQGGERLKIARVTTSNFALLEWACEEGDDLEDPDVVKLANPASFVYVSFLLEQIASPGLHPVELATYHANVWRTGIDSWLPHGAWAACLDPDGAVIPPGAEVFGGVDMGRRNDRGAIVIVHVLERDDDAYITDCVVQSHIYDPADQPDGVLAFSTVENAIRDIAREYQLAGMAYDPWRFDRSAELLENEGIRMMQHDQTDARMGPATQWLYEAINLRRIRHDGDAELAAHVNACHAVALANGGVRLKKDPKAKKPVDAGHALSNAFSIATQLDDEISSYSYGGL